MGYGPGKIKRKLQERKSKKVTDTLCEFVTWEAKNGKSIDFLRSLKARGKKSALDNMPLLDGEETEIWNVYCVLSNPFIVSLDIYSRHEDLPCGWVFIELLNLMLCLEDKRLKATKKKSK